MADPLTVVGAIASSIQIIDVLTKAISALDTLRAQWQSSDIALLSLTSQLGALSAALSKIQEWMESGVDEVHHQLVMDLNTSISCCKMLASKLYSEISDLQKAPGGSLLTTTKARFMFKRSGVGELQSMIDRQTAALTLLLTACNSKSLSKQQEILGTSGARKRMDRVYEDTESLRGTLDSSSFHSRSTERSSRLSMLFDFDDQLFSSRSYKAMIRKTVKLSIRSPGKHAPGPEEVITRVSSNAIGSTSPAVPLLGNIDQQIMRPRNRLEPTKIVLLGQGESSKTTFVKHLEWIYGPGFPTEEREVWRNIIHDDLLTAYHGLQRAYEKKCPYGIELENDIWPRVMRIELASGDQPELFQSAFPYVFKRLVDESADIVMRNGGAGSLPDNIDYFVNHLVRICDINYIPTGGDILRARTRTTGIHRYTYTSPDYKSFQVYDVGGERSERKKCIKVFDQSAVVLLFVPIDSYDQILYEDENTNRMQEALTLFKSLVNTEDWWKESRMSLCFTKCDLFEKKIQSGSTPLNVYFPEYAGSPTDVAECRKYITWRFTQLLEQRSELGVFYLDVTDTGHVREVVETSLGGGYSTSPRYNHFDRRGDSLHENVTRI